MERGKERAMIDGVKRRSETAEEGAIDVIS